MDAPPDLLTLPQELRDRIYTYATIEDQDLRIKTKKPASPQQLATGSALLLLCKQISTEYSDYLLTVSLSACYETALTTTVTNLIFTPISAFINSLTNAQLLRYRAKPKLRIRPVFPNPEQRSRQRMCDTLKPWADLCKAKGIHAHYEIDDAASGPGILPSNLYRHGRSDRTSPREEEELFRILNEWRDLRVLAKLRAEESISRKRGKVEAAMKVVSVMVSAGKSDTDAVRVGMRSMRVYWEG